VIEEGRGQQRNAALNLGGVTGSVHDHQPEGQNAQNRQRNAQGVDHGALGVDQRSAVEEQSDDGQRQHQCAKNGIHGSGAIGQLYRDTLDAQQAISDDQNCSQIGKKRIQKCAEDFQLFFYLRYDYGGNRKSSLLFLR